MRCGVTGFSTLTGGGGGGGGAAVGPTDDAANHAAGRAARHAARDAADHTARRRRRQLFLFNHGDVLGDRLGRHQASGIELARNHS